LKNYWSKFNALCIPSINKLARSFLTILVLQLPLQRFRLLLQKLFTMPGKRKVNYSSRSVFWPCGDCRKNCTANSVQCDTCNSWYHYSCQQLDLPDIEYIIRPDASFTCKTCHLAEIGQFTFESSLLRLRMLLYVFFLFL